MKVSLSVPGKFHTFDLARELYDHGALAGVLTAYPRFKLRAERLPDALIHTYPWVMVPYLANPFKSRMSGRFIQDWEELAATTFRDWVARSLPDCDVYVGLSGTSLHAGQRQQAKGGSYVCDRGSSHIKVQDVLLREEHNEWGLAFDGIDARVIEREEAEYAQADCITVPSSFSFRSFVEQGVSSAKMRLLPYGVNLSRFAPSGAPDADRFDILFVGSMTLQKGVPYLLLAFKQIRHPRKSLTFAGGASPQIIALMKTRGLWSDDIKVLGHVPQLDLKQLMSKSHALVLPSIQDGFGMVMAQAMACGCPVIASENTGARDLFDDGRDGFIVPIRDSRCLAERLQQLADDPALREQMAASALGRVKRMGGWRDYGQSALKIYQSLV